MAKEDQRWTSIALLLAAAKRLGVKVKLLNKEKNIRLFSKGRISILCKDHVLGLNSYVSSRIVNDKSLTRDLLRKINAPIPKGFASNDPALIATLMRKHHLRPPVVIKPIAGASGRDVYTNIASLSKLAECARLIVKKYTFPYQDVNGYLVEEQVTGGDYRFLVLDGKVLTVIKREPAYVTGDGRRTLAALIALYNKRPDVGPKMPLCPIVVDDELRKYLRVNHRTLAFRPAKDAKIYVRANANVSTGGRTVECANLAHPRYLRLTKNIATFLGLRFCSVDLIAPDISRYRDFHLIEVNHTPGLDIHEAPFEGKPCPVSDYLIKAAFSD